MALEPMSASGRSKRRTTAQARPISSSSAASVAQPIRRGRSSGASSRASAAKPKVMRWPSASTRTGRHGVPGRSLPGVAWVFRGFAKRASCRSPGCDDHSTIGPSMRMRSGRRRVSASARAYIGRRADLRGERVDVIGDQRAREVLPAVAQRGLHADHEHHAHGQREHHEQADEANAERVTGLAAHAAPAGAQAAPPGGSRAWG